MAIKQPAPYLKPSNCVRVGMAGPRQLLNDDIAIAAEQTAPGRSVWLNWVGRDNCHGSVKSVVGERLVAPGAVVSPQSPLVTLVPPALELVVNIDASRLGRVREGQHRAHR
jgi:hypothetical protein